MLGTRRRALPRMVWAIIIGLFLGALFTKLAIRYLPDSGTREFLTTAVSASLGPLGVDLVAVAFVIGPLVLNLNALSLVGILIVALVMRSWWF
ncbi:MAG: hypothetical protein GWM90_32685 [Gemmatimonadetes bacterium]|nr:hypothetical protein [Gemmatimonadota bacterium]NIQ60043.1 hypothetical protein [Gemmatimonadota bacterium]NIU80261.1 hypothetical protein [Gammaproteobacteria bacterium]NIX48643.1 hypothetical protein [Gemmatimonadota bacterium]NIY13084.1 hypothetical protein [Gemmatimonadota bacterium]